MNRLKIGLFLRMALGTLLLASIVGCSGYYRGGPPVYRSEYYNYPYHYYYYPSSSVYFHLSSGHYHYLDGDFWKRANKLPPKYHLDHRDRVPVWLDTDKPFTRYKGHRDKYRPRPDFRPDPKRDSEERRNNERMHERYRNR